MALCYSLKQSTSGIFLSERACWNLVQYPLLCSPLANLAKLAPTLSDPYMYRSVVGALQYATLTRPEISFSVNKVCQFMSHPLESHWVAVKRIMQYLKGTLDHGLTLYLSPSSQTPTLKAFYDIDWASDPDDRRNTSGAVVYFGSNLVSWWSRKQPMVARSSTEVEYRSLAHVTVELSLSLSLSLIIPYCMPELNTWKLIYFLSEKRF